MTLIEVTDVRKAYGGVPAVDGISLSVEEGEVLGILGPNGAGKTTLVECIAGLRRPDGGTIRVAGLEPRRQRAELTRVLGVQLQDGQLQDKLTVREALELFSAFYPEPVPYQELAERLGLADRYDARFAKLSGGQKQRLYVALALVGRPRAVILDELTTGLDPRARREVWELIAEIRERGCSVLLVTHFMEEAERLCDRVALVQSGRVRALDTPAGLVAATDAAIVISFVPSRDLDLDTMRPLPGVRTVTRTGERVAVTGAERSSEAVLAELSRQGVAAQRLRVTDATLDDAFVALTDSTLEELA